MKVRESDRVSLQKLCRLLGYTRQAYYGHFRDEERAAISCELVLQQVERIRADQKRIGARKLHYLLTGFMRQMGMSLGRDRFFDLLREHGFLVRKRRPRKPRTTASCWWLKKYPNLTSGFIPNGANQVWVADITYIRVGLGFAYLSLITDAYSRKIVGYNLSRDLTAGGSVRALKMAMKNNPCREELRHHSDRGVQYYSAAYTKLLKRAGVPISMSEKSNPLENPIAERVNGILKIELLETRFAVFREAEAAIDKAVSIYNHQRPHDSIERLTPAEAHLRQGELKRLWKNYYRRRNTEEAVNAAV
jgi:putative transposase